MTFDDHHANGKRHDSDIFDSDYDAERAEAIEEREQVRDELAPPKNTASEKQITYIADLLDKKQIDEKAADEIRKQIAAGKVDSGRASRYLDKLIALPRRTQDSGTPKTDTRGEEPEVGMYRTKDGTIVRVYLGQKSGRNLVKRLVSEGDHHEYEYVGAAANGRGAPLLVGAERLSLDEAKAFGRMTGTCCVCARRLDVPESVEAGIGPVCASKF